MLALRCLLFLASLPSLVRKPLATERAAEVPEYVLVVAIVAMLAVAGLVAVKTGLVSNLNNIASCLTGTAAGTATSCV